MHANGGQSYRTRMGYSRRQNHANFLVSPDTQTSVMYIESQLYTIVIGLRIYPTVHSTGTRGLASYLVYHNWLNPPNEGRSYPTAWDYGRYLGSLPLSIHRSTGALFQSSMKVKYFPDPRSPPEMLLNQTVNLPQSPAAIKNPVWPSHPLSRIAAKRFCPTDDHIPPQQEPNIPPWLT